MPEYVDLSVTVKIPDTDRDKQLQLHVLENFRNNWRDEDIFDERSSASGFGHLEYNRMIETLAEEDYLTREHWLPSLYNEERRLSQLGQAYLEYLQRLDIVQVVAPVAPLPPQSTPAAPLAAGSRPWWRNFWRKDVGIIMGVVGAIAMVAIAFNQCGTG